MPTPPPPLAGARLLFALDPAVAHLNHGSFGAVPVPVRRAQQRLRDEQDVNPMRFFTQGLVDRLAHARRHIAVFLGADPDGTALVPNATAGVAAVLRSLRLGPHDEIVVTDHGYPTVTLAVERERQHNGVTVRTVSLPLSPGDDDVVEAVTAVVRPDRTRLVIADLVTSPTARLMPVSRLAAELAAAGVPLLVDAAHGPGMVPTAVDAIGAPFWVGNLHKWAFAPPGSAALVVAPAWRSRMEPLVVAHQYPAGFPAAFESQGTRDYTAWLSTSTGLFVLRSLGPDEVRTHNAALAAYGQHTIGGALGLDPTALPDPGGSLGMRIVPLPAGVASTVEEATVLRLRIASELRTETAIMSWRGRGLLRLSAQVYNRADEYDRLADQLPALLPGRR